ncbi:Rieske 2Fe-2S domain-containing protein [Nocardia nova]|uniref:aromatic ring-hydroxylating dioxygenase subunit alpha n=1 Tax=Nocardia nova TaxID=37330 RepID=UPI0025B05F61|nr:Rieske 2Fe-2S domain-containing protein [Nocardia nova]MDN2496569.1 Rieske 2Fe-2S domain-containing protein [Nocardia nova]
MTELPSARPTGWFQVAWSADLRDGEVKALHYFDTELVAFRGNDGHVRVLDAHCRHLGAHLGHGGCVVGNDIQCPFHGWRWNGDGRNTHIPYHDKPNRVRRVGAWPVTERNESIYIWHDSEGRPPSWEVPDAFPALGDHIARVDYFPLTELARSRHARIHVHPQVIAENAVDPWHFRFVHHTPHAPAVLRETVQGARWQSKVGFGRRWSDGVDRAEDTSNTIEILWSGIGLSFNGEVTADGIRVIAICPTPVDDTTTDIFATYWIDKDNGRYDERLAQAKLALPDDIAIWEHQKYMDPPGLAPSEAAGFRRLRTWATRFYPETAHADPNSAAAPV